MSAYEDATAEVYRRSRQNDRNVREKAEYLAKTQELAAQIQDPFENTPDGEPWQPGLAEDQHPVTDPVGNTSQTGGGPLGDFMAGVGAGVARESADLIDNAAEGIQQVLHSIWPTSPLNTDPNTAQRIQNALEAIGAAHGVGAREQLDEGLPESETVSMAAGEALGPLGLMMFPLIKAFAGPGKAAAAMRNVGAPMLYATATNSPGEGNLGNALEDFAGDNVYSAAMAVDEGDDYLTRLAKVGAEDVLFSVVGELVGPAAKAVSKWRGGKAAIADVVNTSTDVASDDELLNAAEEVVGQRAKVEANRALDQHLTTAQKVYHGTQSDTGVTKMSQLDTAKAVETEGVVFVTDSPDIADQFTLPREYGEVVTEMPTGELDEFGDPMYEELIPGPVVEGYLAPLNPLRVSGEAAQAAINDTAEQARVIAEAREAGHDVVIFEGVTEFAGDARGNVYAVLDTRMLADADDPVADIVDVMKEQVRGAKGEAEGKLAAAEARLAKAAETTQADGRVVEAARQATYEPRQANNPTNQALGKAAERQMGAAPERVVLTTGIDVHPDTARRIGDAIRTGSLDEAASALGAIYDSTNYEKIIDDPDGTFESILRLTGEVYGQMEGSLRVQTSRSLPVTEELARKNIAQLAKNSGNTPEKIIENLDKMLPGKNLDVQVTSIRLMEMSLTSRLNKLANDVDGDQWTLATENEMIRVATLLAHVNDRRAGLASELGRALNALKIKVDDSAWSSVLGAGAGGRTEAMNRIVLDHGGSRQIKKLARMIKAAQRTGSPDAAVDAISKLSKGIVDPSLMDILHNQFVSNSLSGFNTLSLNLGSNAARSLIWEPTHEFFGAAGVTAFKMMKGEKGEMWRFTEYVRGAVEGTRAALRLVADPETGRMTNNVIESFRSRKAITASSGYGKNIDVSNPAKLTADNLTQALSNNRVTRPMMAAARWADQNVLMPMTGSNPGEKVSLLASYGARVIDFVGRATEFPFAALAAGDELAKSINKTAKLRQQSFIAASKEGASGADLAARADELMYDANNMETIMEALDPTNPDDIKRVELAMALRDESDLFAQKTTYTAPPGEIAKAALAAKNNVPGLRWFLPFMNTPIQILESGLGEMFLPGKIHTELRRAVESGDPDEIARVGGQLALVGAMNYGFYEMAVSGNLMGSGPLNFASAEVARDLGENKPFHFRLPDYMSQSMGFDKPVSVAYDRWDPVAIPMIVAADLADLVERLPEERGDELMKEFFGHMWELVASRTFVEGMTKFQRMLEDPLGYGTDIVVSIGATSVTPLNRMWAGIERGGLPVPEWLVEPEPDDSAITMTLKDFLAGDPKKYIVEGKGGALSFEGVKLQFGSRLAAGLPPGVSEGFVALWNTITEERMNLSKVPDLDFLGNPRHYPQGLGPNVASPYTFTVTEGTKTGRVGTELARMGYGASVNRSFGSLYGVLLTPEMRNEFQTLFAKTKRNGRDLTDALDALMFTPDGEYTYKWGRLGDSVGDYVGGKEKAVQQIVADYRKVAEREMLEEYADLRAAYKQQVTNSVLVTSSEGSDEVRQSEKASTGVGALLRAR